MAHQGLHQPFEPAQPDSVIGEPRHVELGLGRAAARLRRLTAELGGRESAE